MIIDWILTLYVAARGYPRPPNELGEKIGHHDLLPHIQRFLHDQLNPDAEIPGDTISLDHCPEFLGHVFVHHSAIARFYAPSDVCGRHGMHKERIHACPMWRKEAPRYDCVFINHDPDKDGFKGLFVARVFLFFSFTHQSVLYPCALVHWFSAVGDGPCPDTGLWVVEPEYSADGTPHKAVIHLDCILRGAHLMGVAGKELLPLDFSCHDSLDAFQTFYVNKLIDGHAHEIAF